MFVLRLNREQIEFLLFALAHLHEPAPVAIPAMPIALATHNAIAAAAREARARPRLVEESPTTPDEPAAAPERKSL